VHFENAAWGIHPMDDGTAYLARTINYTSKIFMKLITGGGQDTSTSLNFYQSQVCSKKHYAEIFGLRILS
jgi:hypothetical protein